MEHPEKVGYEMSNTLIVFIMPVLPQLAFSRKLERAEGEKKLPCFSLQQQCMAWH